MMNSSREKKMGVTEGGAEDNMSGGLGGEEANSRGEKPRIG